MESSDDLRDQDFEGFLSMRELAQMPDTVPAAPGVYVVLRRDDNPVRFLDENPGGRFKGRNPTVPVDRLRNRWVPTTPIVYVGKAGGPGRAATLRSRLRQFFEFGHGKAVGHWGGRLVWQLADAWSLSVCWKVLNDVDPRDVEKQMLRQFRLQHGRLPYANLAS